MLGCPPPGGSVPERPLLSCCGCRSRAPFAALARRARLCGRQCLRRDQPHRGRRCESAPAPTSRRLSVFLTAVLPAAPCCDPPGWWSQQAKFFLMRRNLRSNGSLFWCRRHRRPRLKVLPVALLPISTVLLGLLEHLIVLRLYLRPMLLDVRHRCSDLVVRQLQPFLNRRGGLAGPDIIHH